MPRASHPRSAPRDRSTLLPAAVAVAVSAATATGVILGVSSTGTAQATTSSPSGSCAAAWAGHSAYTSSTEVSYIGVNWTASRWNYDEVPGGSSGAWNYDGSC